MRMRQSVNGLIQGRKLSHAVSSINISIVAICNPDHLQHPGTVPSAAPPKHFYISAALAALAASVVPPAELWSLASPVTGVLTLAFFTLFFIGLAFAAGRTSAFADVWSFASPTCGGTTPGLMFNYLMVLLLNMSLSLKLKMTPRMRPRKY